MSDKIKIEKNIPMPKGTKITGMTATFKTMKVGDSFVIKTIQVNSTRSSAHNARVKVSIRQISETESRVWRTA